MEKWSYFIEDKAIFGSFPTQENVEYLEKIGVKYFVNLTYCKEKLITPYKTNKNIITFPITDRKIPNNIIDFSKFIIKISNIINKLEKGELIYIHCKGGHGRSGIVVATLLCYIYKINAKDSILLTNKYHNERTNMKEKWRKIGSPQTFFQKNFVHKCFKPLYFFKAYNTGPYVGFSNFSLHPVTIKNVGTFPTSEAAFQALKDLSNKEYVQKQKRSYSPNYSKKLGKKIQESEYFLKNKEKIMYEIILNKFLQNKDIKLKLLNTGLRPIIYNAKKDFFWGIGHDNTGKNKLGKILERIRIECNF
tara:strand:- start:118 stop:1032 length:915 start_codon:yes stop_codon:yes gene_type:complete